MNTYQEKQLDALGDPTRRAILERLLQGSLPVGELARDFPISRPAISQHLKILKEAHLVVVREAGNRRLYGIDAEGVANLRSYFDRFWADALAAFKRAADGAVPKEETQ